MEKKYLVPLILFILIGCKKPEKSPPTQLELLKGSTWSLYSEKKKTHIESTNKITLDTLIIGDCSMKSRLRFFDNDVVKYTDNCLLIKDKTLDGTWGITSDNKIFTKIILELSPNTGYSSYNFGFYNSEIVEIDKNHFILKRFDYYSFISSTETTKYITEIISTYKKVD